MTDDPAALTSTVFDLSGVTDHDDVGEVTDRVSTVPGVGAVAIELTPGGGARMFLKHKADVVLDRAAIAAAVRQAGGAVVAERGGQRATVVSEPATHHNLLAGGAAGPAPTLLPVLGPDLAEEASRPDVVAAVVAQPAASLGWARLAEAALMAADRDSDVAAYAYARTGYHRGLDALRRAGWKGSGPIPYEHEPNRGFLRALAALAEAARRIGDDTEFERCAQFLRDSTEAGYLALIGTFTDGPAR